MRDQPQLAGGRASDEALVEQPHQAIVDRDLRDVRRRALLGAEPRGERERVGIEARRAAGSSCRRATRSSDRCGATPNDAAISIVRVMTLGRGIASTSSTRQRRGRRARRASSRSVIASPSIGEDLGGADARRR